MHERCTSVKLPSCWLAFWYVIVLIVVIPLTVMISEETIFLQLNFNNWSEEGVAWHHLFQNSPVFHDIHFQKQIKRAIWYNESRLLIVPFICTFCSVCDRKSAKCNFQSCGLVLSANLWKMMLDRPNCDSLHASLYRRDPDTIHRLFKCWKCTWRHAESGYMAACNSLLHYLINYLSHDH